MLGLNDFDCGLITGSCRVRIFPRDPSLNSCYHQPGIALFTVPDNNRRLLIGKCVCRMFHQFSDVHSILQEAAHGRPLLGNHFGGARFFNSSAGLYGIR